MDKNDFYLNRALEKLKKEGFNVAAIFLQGSQNYDIDVYDRNYQSDFDFKAFVYPAFENLFYGKTINKTIEEEYGQIVIKDLRDFPKLILKANPTYVELFYSKAHFGELDDFIKSNQAILSEVKGNFFNATVGTFNQKTKEVFRERPGNLDSFKRFGYDNKSFSHALRYLIILKKFIAFTESGKENYVDLFRLSDADKDKVLEYKTATHTKDFVQKELDKMTLEVNEIVSEKKFNYPKREEKQPRFDDLEKKVFELVKNNISK